MTRSFGKVRLVSRIDNRGPNLTSLLAKSSLPIVRHAVRNEELSAANQLDRMTIWIRNVESMSFLVFKMKCMFNQ